MTPCCGRTSSATLDRHAPRSSSDFGGGLGRPLGRTSATARAAPVALAFLRDGRKPAPTFHRYELAGRSPPGSRAPTRQARSGTAWFSSSRSSSESPLASAAGTSLEFGFDRLGGARPEIFFDVDGGHFLIKLGLRHRVTPFSILSARARSFPVRPAGSDSGVSPGVNAATPLKSVTIIVDIVSLCPLHAHVEGSAVWGRCPSSGVRRDQVRRIFTGTARQARSEQFDMPSRFAETE